MGLDKRDEIGIITDNRPVVPKHYLYCSYCDTYYSTKRYELCPTCDLVSELTQLMYKGGSQL